MPQDDTGLPQDKQDHRGHPDGGDRTHPHGPLSPLPLPVTRARSKGERQRPSGIDPIENVPYSDYTNAREFVSTYGADLRYCHTGHTWLIWQNTHWRADESAEVQWAAKQIIKGLLGRAATM